MRGLVLACSNAAVGALVCAVAGAGIVAAIACGNSAPAKSPSGDERVLGFSVVTMGRRSGDAEIRIEPDGKRRSRYTYSDRGAGPDMQTQLVFDPTVGPRWFRVTGHDYLHRPVDERLDEAAGTLRWRSTSEAGEAPLGTGWYVAAQASFDPYALIARALRHTHGHRLRLLPAGEAWIDDDATREFDVAGARRQLRRVAVAGLDFAPKLIWLDEDDELFAGVEPWTSVIRSGAEASIPALLADDRRWSGERTARLASRLAHHPAHDLLAFTHARLYDSERRRIVPDATVIVSGDRIAAVGGPGSPVPAGAEVIDAHGRTLLPGLWDMHVHLQTNEAGALYLASGITTVRDLGNRPEELDPRVGRFDAGTEIGPHVLRAGMIDAPSAYRSPTGILANTLDEALDAVRRYTELGYVQIKIYNSIPPDWVPAIAAAAHARGLRVSGHIPNGMNAAQAVQGGFDEIQHVNFLFLRFLAGPGDDTRTLLRLTRVAERGAELDLAGAEVQQFLDLLIARRTVLDPTLSRFDAQFTTDPGELDPMLVPYADRLPAQVVRSSRTGGLTAADGQRARFRASYAAMLRLVKLAWDRHIPIVAGTDNIPGLALPHELELYVRAGIPATEVLAIATLGAARVMHQDRETGSIAAGKRADLVLIDGDPTVDISTIRNTDVVVCRGVVYQPDELFVAAGMRGRNPSSLAAAPP